MNYLLVVAAVFAGNDGYQWLMQRVTAQESGTMYQGEKGTLHRKLQLTIDKAESMTTLEVTEDRG